jgi:hypothetical protein
MKNALQLAFSPMCVDFCLSAECEFVTKRLVQYSALCDDTVEFVLPSQQGQLLFLFKLQCTISISD